MLTMQGAYDAPLGPTWCDYLCCLVEELLAQFGQRRFAWPSCPLLLLDLRRLLHSSAGRTLCLPVALTILSVATAWLLFPVS